MIEINLVPDVKQELIRAQRVRSAVISLAVVIGIGAIAVVVLLLMYLGVQQGRSYFTEQTITSESKKLSQVEDVSNVLTLQNQLAQLSSIHDEKHITSRVFDVLSTVTPQGENAVSISNLTIDATEDTIRIEAQTPGGYPALDVFKKTIAATKLGFTRDNQPETMPLATNISSGESSYGQDAEGKAVLRFSLSFEYPAELFTRAATNAQIIAPSRTNATDSVQGVPNSLFTVRANDATGGEQ